MARAAARQRNFAATNNRARRMRRQPTRAEAAMWQVLRRLLGFHFRRQVALKSNVYDFGDHGARLLVEVDGGVHDAPFMAGRDAAKDEAASVEGYRVLRIDNEIILREPDLAAELVIRAALDNRPPPLPPPHRGEGNEEPPTPESMP